jgi:predicted transcriptional regulator
MTKEKHDHIVRRIDNYVTIELYILKLKRKTESIFISGHAMKVNS